MQLDPGSGRIFVPCRLQGIDPIGNNIIATFILFDGAFNDNGSVVMENGNTFFRNTSGDIKGRSLSKSLNHEV